MFGLPLSLQVVKVCIHAKSLKGEGKIESFEVERASFLHCTDDRHSSRIQQIKKTGALFTFFHSTLLRARGWNKYTLPTQSISRQNWSWHFIGHKSIFPTCACENKMIKSLSNPDTPSFNLGSSKSKRLQCDERSIGNSKLWFKLFLELGELLGQSPILKCFLSSMGKLLQEAVPWDLWMSKYSPQGFF